MHHPRIDPSPTALRSPLSPRRGIKIKTSALSLGERGDRKAVGEGSLSTPSDFDGTLASGSRNQTSACSWYFVSKSLCKVVVDLFLRLAIMQV